MACTLFFRYKQNNLLPTECIYDQHASFPKQIPPTLPKWERLVDLEAVHELYTPACVHGRHINSHGHTAAIRTLKLS